MALLAVAGWALSLTFGAPSAAQSLGAPTLQQVVEGEWSLTVAWSAPAGATGIVGYDVRFIESSSTFKSDDSAWTVNSDVWTGGNLTAVVSGLINGTSYDVAVRARTSSVTSGWSTAMAGTPTDPGDTVAGASTVQPDVPLHAELGYASDVDFYTFTVTSTVEYIIWTTGDTDTLGELTQSDGASYSTPITDNNWELEPGPNNFMMSGSLNAGTYFFKVTPGPRSESATDLWEGAGPYAVHLHLAGDTTGTADARTVTLGDITPGVSKNTGLFLKDYDYYKLILPTATTVSAHVETPYTGGMEGQILDSMGTVVTDNNDGYLEPNWYDFALRASLDAGTYYIKLQQGSFPDGVPYFLRVNQSPTSAATRTDAVDLPMHVVAGGTAAQDSDALFKIALTEQTPIDLSGSSTVDEMTVELQDSDGDPLPVSVHKVPEEVSTTPTFVIREVLDAGTYYLNVKFETAGKSGEFLTLLQPDHRYARQARQCPYGRLGVGDHLHGCQWHLLNTAHPGEDINLGNAWRTTKGAGINVMVVDEGINYLHADLRENFDLTGSGSAFGNDPAEELLHETLGDGTAVAGIIGARDNGVGLVGVAPRATISAYQYLGHGHQQTAANADSEAFSLNAAQVSIRNHSWSPAQVAPREVLSDAVKAALDTSRTTGDGGRGTLQIQSAGNEGMFGGYASNSPYLNYRGFAAVCGVDHEGGHNPESNQGPNLWVCAPSLGEGGRGIATTHTVNRYLDNPEGFPFRGPKAATPMVSGVAALVRAANRELSWRDTKLILADSARVVSSADGSWETGAPKYRDPSQTYRYSHKFGFGVVDAERAVGLAVDWKPLPAEKSTSSTQNTTFTVAALQTTPAESSIEIAGSVTFTEHVEVTFDIEAPHFRHLDIELVSPSGNTSKLSVPISRCPFGGECDVSGTAVMSTTRHLGEDPRGTWTLRITDGVSGGDPTTVKSWSLQVYGHTRAQVVAPARVWVAEEAGSASIELSGDPLIDVSVTTALADGTATGGSDCSAAGVDFDNDAPTAQTLTAGTPEHSLEIISVCSDTTEEGNETFVVTLTATPGVFDASEPHCSAATTCTVTVTVVDDESLEAPMVRHVVEGEGSLTVAWTPPVLATGIVGYDVRYIESSSTSKNDDSAWTVVADAWQGWNPTAVIGGLTDNTSYDVAVRARTASLRSDWSSAVAGTPADPGETVATATTVQSDVPLHAELSSSSDVDFYKFTVTEDSEYSISTSGGTATLTELTRSDGSSRDPPLVYSSTMLGRVTPGTYFFRILPGSFDAMGPYALHVHISADTTGPADARTVTLGSRTRGVLLTDFYSSVLDKDFFELVLPAATTISAHVESSALEVLGRILDESGKVVVPNQAGYLLPNVRHFALHASLPAGRYYIEIFPSFAAFTGPYVLHVNESPVPASTRAEAAHLPMDVVAGGTTMPDADGLFRLVLAEPTPIEWSGSSQYGETAVELWDQSGDLVEVAVYRYEYPLRLTSVHTFVVREVLDAGTYYLNFKSDTGAGQVPFLTVLRPDSQYAEQARRCSGGQLGIPDPLHGCQWHLHNTGQRGGVPGEDINLGEAWATTKGAGVTVTVVDDGLDYLHPDLRDNFDLARSGSAFGDPAEQLLEGNDHGTNVAGIIAARDNEKGLVGVAPRATVSAYQIFHVHGLITDLAGLIESFSLHAGDVSIRNHSWTPVQVAPREVLAATVKTALDTSMADGDGNRGTLQIMSAGNEGQSGGHSSFNPYLTHRSLAAVCGVDDQGAHAPYSTQGPNLWVCGPTEGDFRPGIATTKPEAGYELDFSGTSASTPIVSGVAALVRAANRELSWRDTKLILADSARVANSTDSSWETGAPKYSDPSQTYRYSHKFGFGVVDAERAVELALDWNPLPAEMSTSATQNTPFIVADQTPVESELQLDGSVTFVEHVEVTLGINAFSFRDLEIELESPSGTISELSVPFTCQRFVHECDVSGTTVMSSSRHLGEDPRGTWTLRITDTVGSGILTSVISWSLQIYGHTLEPVFVPAGVWVPEEGGSASIGLKGDPRAGASVSVTFADGTATGGSDCSTAGVDYDNDAPAAQTLTSGETEHSLNVITVCSENVADGDETFTVTLTASPGVFDSSPPHCSSSTTCTVKVTIVDDDMVVKVPTTWGLVPSGLAVGDRFRLLFRTSTTRDATATAIGEYDRFVRAAASATGAHDDLGNHAHRFKVFGSTEAVSARVHNGLWDGSGWVDGSTTVSSSGVPTYWLGGGKYAANYFELCAFGDLSAGEKTALENRFHYANIRSESGAAETIDRDPFTGTGQSCETRENLFLGASTDVGHGAAGAATAGGDAWDFSPWSEGSRAGSESGPLYALSPVFTVSSDPTVDLVVAPTSVTEDGSVAVSVTISAAQSQDITIPLAFTDDAATKNTDYTPISGLVIPANMTSSAATMLSTTQDDIYEKDEKFTISLGALPATVQAGVATAAEVTITDDADRPEMSIAWTGGATTVEEGAAASFTVTADRASSFDQGIAVSTLDGSAAPLAEGDADYTALSGATVTMTAGSTTAVGTVNVTEDRLDESAREQFRVELDTPPSSADYTIAAGNRRSANIGIIDQDPTQVTLTVVGGAAAVAENGGEKVITVETGRAMEGSESLTVALDLKGTAAAGTDYTLSTTCAGGVTCDFSDPADPTITFTSGGRTVSVTLTATQDTTDEGNHETVTVGLGALTTGDWSNLDGGGAHQVRPTTFAIIDDDLPQSLAAPTVRHVVAGEGSLTVAWAPPTPAAGIVGYDVRHIESSSTSKNDDSAWTVVADAWKGDGLAAAVSGLTDGTSYDVAVRARTASLTGDWSAAVAATPAEAGSTVAGAATLHSDVPLHAALSSATDVDFYTFTVTTTSKYVIRTTGDTDTLGELTLSDGTSRSPRITHNNEGGGEEYPNNFTLFGAITPGTYFFKVTPGPEAASFTHLWNGTGNYTLHLHLSEDTTGRSDARTVMLGDKTAGQLTATVLTPDSDFFELYLPTATTISAHVGLPSFDIFGQILDSSGNLVTPHRPGFLEPAGSQVALRASLPAGTHYIQLVQGLQLRDEPYSLYVNESPGPAPTRGEAVNLPRHVVGGGTAAHDSDALFRLDLTERTPIEWSGSSRIDEMVVELQNPDGDPLAVSVYQDTHDRVSETVHTFLIREVLDAGTYYLNVKFNNPQSTGEFLTLWHTAPGYEWKARLCPTAQQGVSDPLFGCQWYLHNAGQLGGAQGEDINLGDAWTTTKGAGVTVTVVDEGIDYRHAELRENFDLDTSGSAFGDPADVLPIQDTDHGTQVAGIIAARDNGVGIVGVAPRATISAYQAFSPDGRIADLAGLVEAFSLHAAQVSIRNHSWGPIKVTPVTTLPAVIRAALDMSRTIGDGGRGTLQISSAGNNGQEGDYTSYDRYLNYRGVVAVCGVDDQGDIYTHSNRGPNLWVCAPTDNGPGRWGIAATLSRNRYWMGFSGTSASAPIVSGVAALVRAANRELSWRDTKLILADSARVVSSTDSSWADGASKYSYPSQTYRYSHKFGFGVVDAQRAVALAVAWTPLPAEMSTSATQSTTFTVDSQTPTVQSSLQLDGSVSFVEHVEVTLDISSSFFRDLDIDLVSPSGTISELSVPFGCTFGIHQCDLVGTTVMSSSRHLGEDPRGTWTLRITDTVGNAIPTTVNSWSLQVYGHEKRQLTTKALLTVAPAKVTEGGSFTYTIGLDRAPGTGNRVTVNFNTADGTATAGEDYTPLPGGGQVAVSFGPTETSKTVTVNTLRGVVGHDEPEETLRAWISEATLYVGSDLEGTSLTMDPQMVSVTIDDHPADVTDLWLEAAAPGVVKNGASAQLVARIANPLSSNINVRVKIRRPQQKNLDFYGMSVPRAAAGRITTGQKELTISAGETSASIDLPTPDDDSSGYGFFEVIRQGQAPSGTTWRPAERGGTTAYFVIEPDAEQDTIYLVAEPEAPEEGETVRLSAHLAQGSVAGGRIKVVVEAVGGGGAGDSDFTLADGVLSIGKNKQSSSTSARDSGEITIAEDGDYDPGETISLTVTSTQPQSTVLAPALTIRNTTPVTAGLEFTDSNEDGVVAEGGSVGVTVTLARALTSGETVDVVLRLPHDTAGTILGDATLGSAGGTGFSVTSPLADVTRSDPDTNLQVTYRELTVRFDGAGAQTGALTLTFGDDGKTADPMLVVPLRIVGVTATGLDEEVAAGVKSTLLIEVETEGVRITPLTSEIAEGGTASYEVSLRTDPAGAVTVSLTSDNQAVATVDKALLTFNSSNYSIPQRVMVTAEQDGDGFDDIAAITHAVTGYGDVTAGPRFEVVVRDDDIPHYIVPDDWGLIPNGVSAGESFRLVAVTSQPTEASSDHVEFYNTFVERLVGAGHTDIRNYAKGFRAWLSTEEVDGRDNTHTDPTGDGTGHPVYWLGTDSRVADDNSGLYGDGTGGWAASGAGRDEKGEEVPADTAVWWGSGTDGTKLTKQYVETDSGPIRLTDIGNPTDPSTERSGPKTSNRVLAISPLLTVDVTPEITLRVNRHAVTEGASVTLTVVADPAPLSDLTVNLSVAEQPGADFVAAGLEGDQTVTITGGASSATFILPITGDSLDEADSVVEANLAPGDRYTVASPSGALIFTGDDDPTSVTITGASTALTEGNTRTFTLGVGRAMQSSESLVAPLTFGGTAQHRTDYTIACPDPLPSGVTCQNFGTTGTPEVTFAAAFIGTAATSVTITLTATDDSLAETGGETVNIGVGTVTTFADLSGGVGTPTDSFAEFRIDDASLPDLSLSFPESDTSVTEGGTVKVRVTSDQQIANAALAFTFDAAGSTGFAVTHSGTESIAIGATTADLTVAVTENSADTSAGTATFTLTDGTNYNLGTGSLTLPIVDNDATVVSLTGTAAEVIEGGNTASFTVSIPRALATGETLPVPMSIAGTAGRNTDYTLSCAAATGVACANLNSGAATVTFTGQAGAATSVTVTLTTADASTVTDGETAVISLGTLNASTGTGLGGGAAAHGTDTSVTFTLKDMPIPGVAITVPEVELVGLFEDHSAAGSGAYSVVLAADPGAEVVVTVTSGDTGAVTVDTDQDNSGNQSTLTFTSSGSGIWSTPQTVTVEAVGDDDSAGERVTITHRAVVSRDDTNAYHGIDISDVTAVVVDDEQTAQTVTVGGGGSDSLDLYGSGAGGDIMELFEGETEVYFFTSSTLLTSSGAGELDTGDDTSATYGASGDYLVYDRDGAAVADTSAVTGFNHADGVYRFTVVANDDSTTESDETFTVTVSDDDADGDQAFAADFTLKDGSRPVVSIAAGSSPVTEGTAATFTLTAVPAPSADITVNVDVTQSGSYAAAGQAGARMVTIGTAGTATLSVGTDDDEADEAAGSITAAIAAGSGYGVGSPRAATVGVNDNDIPVVSIADATTVTEGTALSFTVTASPAPSADITVSLGVTDAANADFITSANETGRTVTIGTSGTATFTLATTADDLDEPNGPVTVTVNTGSGYNPSAAPANSATGTVKDDDATSVTLTGSTAAVTEGDTKTFTLSIGRRLGTPDTTETLTVPLTFGGDAPAATRNTDYTLACASATGVTCSNLNSGSATVQFQGDSTRSAMSVTITLTATADNLAESTHEKVNIGAGTPTGSASLGGGAATPTDNFGQFEIRDPPTVYFSSTTYSGTEGTAITVTVNISPTRSSATSVPFTYTLGSAGAGDYSVSGTPSIAAGESSTTYTITAVQDTIVEASETLTIGFGTLPSGVLEGSPKSATVTIADDGDEATVQIARTSAASVTEGGNATFLLTADQTVETPVTVNLDISETFPAGVVGAEGYDYVTAATATAVIPAGGDRVTYTMATAGDTVDEPNGTVAVGIASGTRYSAGTNASASVAVIDDDLTTVTLTGDATDLEEGSSRDFTLEIGRSMYDGESIDFDFGFAGTATVQTDYTLACESPLPSGITCGDFSSTRPTVTFQGDDRTEDGLGVVVSDTSLTLTLAAVENDDNADSDLTNDPAETANLNMRRIEWNAAAAGTTALAATPSNMRTFTDSFGEFRIVNPSKPTFKFGRSTYSVAEGSSVTVTVNFNPVDTVSRTITVSTSTGTAGSGDFTAISSQDVTFAVGETSKTVTVQTTQDTVVEADETFTIALGAAPSGTQKGTPSTATVTITDTDTVPVTISDAGSGQITEGGTRDFTVTALGTLETDVTVNLGIEEDSVGDADFVTAETATVVIASGSTSATFTLQTVDDGVDEPNGEVTVSVVDGGRVDGGALRMTTPTLFESTVVVNDNDNTAVTLAGSSAALVEGQDRTFTVTIGRGMYDGEALTVVLSVGGTATRGAEGGQNVDYTLTCESPLPTGVTCTNLDSGMPNIAFAGTGADQSASSVTLTISAADDGPGDSGETVTVGVNALRQTNIGVGAATDKFDQFVINDRPLDPAVSFSAAAYSVGEADAPDNALTVRVNIAPTRSRNTRVNIITTHGTASAADWATLPPATVTIPGGASSATFVMRTRQDSAKEGPEYTDITIGASLPSGVVLGSPSTARVTIADDEGCTGTEASPCVKVEVDAATVSEGGTVTLTFTADPAPAATTTINYTVTEQDSSNDYIAAADEGEETVQITAGTTTATATIAVVQDGVNAGDPPGTEGDGAVSVTLGSGTGYQQQTLRPVSVTIHDDDPTRVFLRWQDRSATHMVEGVSYDFYLELGRQLVTPEVLTIPFVFGGDAVFGADYTVACPPARFHNMRVSCNFANTPPAITITGGAPDGDVVGAASLLMKRFLRVTADSVTEPTAESITITPDVDATSVTNLRGGALLDSPFSSTVREPPTTATVTFERAGFTMLESSDSTPIVLRLSTPLSADLTVPIDIADQGLTSGDDYTFPHKVVIPAGALLSDFTIDVDDDAEPEVNEQLTMTIDATRLPNSPTVVTLGANGSATLTVIDDDPLPVRLGATSPSISEGGPGGAITVTLGRPLQTGESLTVPLTIGGVASQDTDYTIAAETETGVTYSGVGTANVTIFFAPGADRATLSVTPLDDDADEQGGESLAITMGTISFTKANNGNPDPVTPRTRLDLKIFDPSKQFAALTLRSTGGKEGPSDFYVAEGGVGTLRVSLNGPTADVVGTVTVTGGGQHLTITSGASLLFTPTSYQDKVVTLQGAEDSATNPEDTVNLRIQLSSTDSEYNNRTFNQRVRVLDNDTEITIRMQTTSVRDAEGNGAYKVYFGTNRRSPVEIPAALMDVAFTSTAGDFTACDERGVNPICPGDWDMDWQIQPISVGGNRGYVWMTSRDDNRVERDTTATGRLSLSGALPNISVDTGRNTFTVHHTDDDGLRAIIYRDARRGHVLHFSKPRDFDLTLELQAKDGPNPPPQTLGPDIRQVVLGDLDALSGIVLRTPSGFRISRSGWFRGADGIVLLAHNDGVPAGFAAFRRSSAPAGDIPPGGFPQDQIVVMEQGQPARPPTTPRISITGTGDVTEGDQATFTIGADPAPITDLTVTLGVIEIHGKGADRVLFVSRPTVTIPAGKNSTTYTHSTHDDQQDLGGGTLTVAVVSRAGYTVSASQGSVSPTITDDDATTDTPSAFVPDADLIAAVTAEADAHANPAAAARLRRIVAGMTGAKGGYTAAQCRSTAADHGVTDAWKPWCDEIERRENWTPPTPDPDPD